MATRADSLTRQPQKPGVRSGKSRNLPVDIPGARITLAGVLLCVVYLGLPVLVLGNLLDLFVQRVLGWCVGLWCVF